MISVCFAGVTGWTAPPIVAAIDEADDLTLSSGVSRSAAGQSLATAAGSRSHGCVYATVAEALESAQADVLIDYTSAAAVKNNVWTAVGAGVHTVIGSSGLTSEDYEELDRLAHDQGVGVIAAGNFPVMAAVLRRAASIAAQHLYRWEIIDYASDEATISLTFPAVPRGNSPRLWRKPASRPSQWRCQICTGQLRHEAPRSAVPGSTRCACPASWSPPKSYSAGRASG
jgi:4-hydroxy-tetrahydrodipicolinate reductase